MYRYYKKKTSSIFVVTIIVVMFLFSILGNTLAYFHIQKEITGAFNIGNINATWYNNTTALTSDTTYELALNNGLGRGNTNGTNITRVDGTAGGDLRIRANTGSADQYVRIKPKVTVGKNLLPYPYNSTSIVTNGITFTDNGNGSVTINGTATAGAFFYITHTNATLSAGTYSLSGCENGSDSTYSLQWNTVANQNTTPITHTLLDNTGIQIYIIVRSGTTVNNVIIKPQLEEGGEATAYESFIGGTNLAPKLTAANYTFNHYNLRTTHEFFEAETPYGTDTICRIAGIEGNTNSDTAFGINRSNVPVTGGKTYTLSFYSRSNKTGKYYQLGNSGTNYRVHIQIGGTYYYLETNCSITTEWTKISLSVDVPIGISSANFNIGNDVPNIFQNEYYDICGVMFEESPVVNEYDPYGDTDGIVDVTGYFTFRFVDQTTYVLGSNNFWRKGSDGWYYYINADTNNKLSASSYALVCNNIVLSGDFPTRYTNRTVKIMFEYESLQSANNPVSAVWGNAAYTILG